MLQKAWAKARESVLWGMFSASPLYSTSKTGLGTDGWGAASDIHIGVGGAFLAEVVLTAA